MLFFIAGFNEYWVIAWVSWCVWMPLVAVLWSKMWRRLGVVTTGEFIERRYGGKPAVVYRIVYALYAYGAWAVIILAYSAVWFTQTVAPILGWTPLQVSTGFWRHHSRIHFALGILRSCIYGVGPVFSDYDRVRGIDVHRR